MPESACWVSFLSNLVSEFPREIKTETIETADPFESAACWLQL